MKLGLIGNGAMAGELRRAFANNSAADITAALVTPGELASGDNAGLPLVGDVEALLATQPDIIAECASQQAVGQHAPAILAAGVPMVIASVGALGDAQLLARLEAACTGNGRIILPAGALAGVDALAAAQADGLESVHYEGRKPPMSWAGAPGVAGIDLAAITAPTVIFEGTAREAAAAFPKNANVAAMLAIAGAGFEATQVRLVADPGVTRNTHCFTATGAFGDMSVEVACNAFAHNPKTSRLAALSVIRAIKNHAAMLVI